MDNNPELNMLYLQKGEIITRLEILQEQLKIVNQNISNIITQKSMEKKENPQKDKEEKIDKPPVSKKEK
jgi:hypothetical protein